MCDQFGTMCWFCRRKVPHPKPPAPKVRRSGEFWRKHHSAALAVGPDEVKDFEKHYAGEGVSVNHRKTESGDFEPVITSHGHWKQILRARGLVDRD